MHISRSKERGRRNLLKNSLNGNYGKRHLIFYSLSWWVFFCFPQESIQINTARRCFYLKSVIQWEVHSNATPSDVIFAVYPRVSTNLPPYSLSSLSLVLFAIQICWKLISIFRGKRINYSIVGKCFLLHCIWFLINFHQKCFYISFFFHSTF